MATTAERSERVHAGLERKRLAERASARLETLNEVRAAWVASANIDDFARWLAAEITKLTEAA